MREHPRFSAGPDGRSGLLVAVMPRGASGEGHDPERFFREMTGMSPNLQLSSSKHEIVGMICPRADLARDSGSGVVVLLHGEIYAGGRSTQAKLLVREYRAGGAPGIGRVDGSFAVLVVDLHRDRIHAITDRWNTRRVFHSSADGVEWFSTARTLDHHPLRDRRLDPAGIAHFLINQLPQNGRTLHQGVRVLRHAAVHSVEEGGLVSRAYWQPEITNEYAARSDRDLRSGLHDRILHAVERRIGGRPSPWLALSGGWDSRSILGAAHELGAPDLRCLSFGEPDGGPRTDPAVAAGVASDLGYPHHFVAGYELDLDQALDENVRTLGTAQLVMETDAWRAVAALLKDGDDPPPLLLGDHGVGCLEDPFMRSPRDVLSSLKIQGMEAVPWLPPLLPATSFSAMDTALEQDRTALLDRVPGRLSLDDTRYWLYLDQRLQRFLGYRESFAGRWSVPRYPLLDYDLVDFAGRLPTRARAGKALLKATASERFPEVFRREAASDGGPSAATWFGSKLGAHAQRIRRQLREEDSPLDELLPPDTLSVILDGILEGRWDGGWARLRRKVGGKLRSEAKRGGVRGSIGRRLSPAGSVTLVSPRRLLVCALHLRTVLALQIVGSSARGD